MGKSRFSLWTEVLFTAEESGAGPRNHNGVQLQLQRCSQHKTESMKCCMLPRLRSSCSLSAVRLCGAPTQEPAGKGTGLRGGFAATVEGHHEVIWFRGAEHTVQTAACPHRAPTRTSFLLLCWLDRPEDTGSDRKWFWGTSCRLFFVACMNSMWTPNSSSVCLVLEPLSSLG